MTVQQAAAIVTAVLGRGLRAAERPLVERLWEVVGGHPLALELAASRVKAGRQWDVLLDGLAAELARLEVLEAANVKVLTQAVVSKKTTEKQRSVRASLLQSVRCLDSPAQKLFAWLGIVAQDGIVNPKMAATLWSLEQETSDAYLRALKGVGLLRLTNDGYRIHNLIRDLAREILSAPGTPVREDDLPGLGLTFLDANRQFLERYRGQLTSGLWHTLPQDGYIQNRLVYHLELAGWDSELDRLLWEETADGHPGWFAARERLGQTAGFLSDVGQIWSFADRAANVANTDVRKIQVIGLQLHCALIISSVNSLSARIPIEVLAAAVHLGLIGLPFALTLARQHPDVSYRVRAMSRLAADLPEPRRRVVLEEALTLARSIDDAKSRVEAVAILYRELPVADQKAIYDEALAAAHSIDHAVPRGEALMTFARHLPPAEGLAVAQSIDQPLVRSRALGWIARERSPADALAIIRSVDDPEIRARWLASVAPKAAENERSSVVKEALDAARCVEALSERASTLSEVARRLSPEDKANLQAEALRMARGISNPSRRAEALAGVAAWLGPEDQAAVLTEALGSAWDDADEFTRGHALKKIASRMPAEEALAIAMSIDDQTSGAWSPRNLALQEVSERLPKDKALRAIREISNASVRAKSLVALAQHLPAASQVSLIAEALRTECAINDSESRLQTLTIIGGQLAAMASQGGNNNASTFEGSSNKEPKGSYKEVLESARSLGDPRARAASLVTIAGQVPSQERGAIYNDALAAVREISDAGQRAAGLVAMSELLPEKERQTLRSDALSAALGVKDPRSRAELLGEISELTPEEEKPLVWSQALAAAREIEDHVRRSVTLATIAQLLPAEEQAPVRDEAISAALEIRQASERVKALVLLSGRLAPEERTHVLGTALGEARRIIDDFSKISNIEHVVKAMAFTGFKPAARAVALTEIAKRLPEKEQLGVFGEALVAARTVEDRYWRAWMLLEIAQNLPADQQQSVLDEAVGAAGGIEGVFERVRVMVLISKNLPAPKQTALLSEALVAARRIGAAHQQAGALIIIATELAVPDRLAVLGEALVTACRIADSEDRANALVEIAGGGSRD